MLADDLARVSRRTRNEGRETIDRIVERMEELDSGSDSAVADALMSAKMEVESGWMNVESLIEDQILECIRSIHAYVTQADFHIQRFENATRRRAGWRDRTPEDQA